jgi:nitrite reductase (NO-forming)
VERSSPPDVAVHETATEFAFDQPTLRVQPGQRVTLTLENGGKTEHNLRIDALDKQVVAKPGQTATAEFTLDQPGSYDFYCAIPGHKEAGMRGTLVVGTGLASDVHTGHDVPAQVGSASTSSVPQAVAAGTTRLPQPQVAPPVNRTEAALVKVDLETTQVTALLADGIAYKFWTFNGTVPGPMIRVRQGDTVELTLRNSPDMPVTHSINLHAVNGPGGGSVDTQVSPGEESTIRFEALHPGVYVYHCMTPVVGQHVANGMYGMIVVEPPGGLSKVDREFYIMQGEFYLQGEAGQKGLRELSLDKMWQEAPDYVVYNGGVDALTGANALKANVGETIRFFFGVGGPNKDSAFHVVGESFDALYPEGAAEALSDVQTTLVPPGGATMAEMKLEAPGHYMIEDHHVGRLEKGAMAHLEVEGAPNPTVFEHVRQSAKRP